MRRLIALLGMTGALLVAAPPVQAGGGCAHRQGPTVGTGTSVAFRNNCMTPTILWTQPGSTVTWVNEDGTEHNVTATAFLVSSDGIRPKGTFKFTFSTAGIYAYACTLHPGMVGAIVAGTPVAPKGTTTLAEPGNVVAPPAPPAGSAVASRSEPATGTVAVASAIAAAIAGATGFAVGRMRRLSAR